MKKPISVILLLLLSGCSSNQYDKTSYNLHEIRGKEVICKKQEEAIKMVKIGFSANTKFQQGLILNKSMKSGLCDVVDESMVVKTGDQVIFPITDQFPESLRGIKKVVFRVKYNNQIYWLVPTGNPK